MSANYKKYCELRSKYASLDESEFFQKIAEEMGTTDWAVIEIWYATQRSWFVPEMVDAIIQYNSPGYTGFRPNLYSGEFEWENGKFVATA